MSKLDELYERLGVRKGISAAGSTTKFGGSKLRSEVTEIMIEASTVMLDMDELNKAAGKMIGELTGAESGLVTSGSAGGLLLQACAVIAGDDPAKMAKLPDTEGMKNEIIIQRSHRFPYDQCYRAAGAKFVEIGDGKRCHEWQLEAAFSDKTTAVAYLFSPGTSKLALPLDKVTEIAHSRGVPVIVDAASMLPPRENLSKYHKMGADLVIHSGGKGIRGPQGTGLLSGKKDLINAAFANASPHQFLGRSAKVAKEEIVGILTALHNFVNEDEEAEMSQFRNRSQKVVDAFSETPGLDVELKHDKDDYLTPNASILFNEEWKGPTAKDVIQRLSEGDSPIFISNLIHPDEIIFDPLNVDDVEVDIVIKKIRESMN